ncbi:hypothetical protein Tco_1341535 [Tanacetum coccineum]
MVAMEPVREAPKWRKERYGKYRWKRRWCCFALSISHQRLWLLFSSDGSIIVGYFFAGEKCQFLMLVVGYPFIQVFATWLGKLDRLAIAAGLVILLAYLPSMSPLLSLPLSIACDDSGGCNRLKFSRILAGQHDNVLAAIKGIAFEIVVVTSWN